MASGGGFYFYKKYRPISSGNPKGFKHLIIDSSPPSAQGCCLDILSIGDIDGDGRADIMAGSENATGVVWYQYPAWSRFVIGAGDFTADGRLADVEADGDTDVIISCISRNAIEWWENLGEPTKKESWIRHTIGTGWAHDVAIGDIDGDGRLDVVTKQKAKNNLNWHESPIDATQPWIEHQIATLSGEGLDAGDLDGDGDLDIAVSHFWYENQSGVGSQWRQTKLTDSWGADCRTIIADMNGDGRKDIVLSHSEGKGRLSWFENSSWAEHQIEKGNLEGAHSLKVGDFDGDKLPDVLTGEMHSSKSKRVLLYRNLGDGRLWDKVELSSLGTHNAQIGDLGGDGDADIVGKNFDGTKAIEMWENLSADFLTSKNWEYVAIDTKRPKSQLEKMGLIFADVNGDAMTDIIAGSCIYENSGDISGKPWARYELPNAVDLYFAVDVDDDDATDLVGISDSTLKWFEAASLKDNAWHEYAIGRVPDGRTQGYTTAQIIPGGKPELIFTRAENLFYVEIPASLDENTPWKMIQVSSTNEEEGVAAGDIDYDGDIDLAAYSADGHHAVWFENPADGSAFWLKHIIGESQEWLDRIALVDVNNDGFWDIVSTEETQDWFYNARVYWFEAPADPKNGKWQRHIVDVLRSVNSMDVTDMDGDGDIDIVAAEHTDQHRVSGAPDNLTLWYENREHGKHWIPHVIECANHCSHLGARVQDLDNDGDQEVISIAWQQYATLHMWKNLAEKEKHESDLP